MQKEKKAVGYIRVSTEEQSKEGISLDTQQERIKAFIYAKGYELVKIYCDEGASGKNLRRKGIQELINDANNKRFDVVVVYKVDRLTRKQKDLWYLLEDVFEKNNIGFMSVTEPFDTTQATGKAFLGMLGVFAQLERDTISERTKDALDHKIKNDEPVGRPPLGFCYKDKSLILNEDEIKLVKYIYQLKENKFSLRKIAERLNKEGFKPKRGDKFYHTTISYILKNSQYMRALNISSG